MTKRTSEVSKKLEFALKEKAEENLAEVYVIRGGDKSNWLSTGAPKDILTMQILKASKGKNVTAQHIIHICKGWPLALPEEIRQFLDALTAAGSALA